MEGNNVPWFMTLVDNTFGLSKVKMLLNVIAADDATQNLLTIPPFTINNRCLFAAMCTQSIVLYGNTIDSLFNLVYDYMLLKIDKS